MPNWSSTTWKPLPPTRSASSNWSINGKEKWIVQARHGGGELCENANGVAENSGTVIVEFDSLEKAKAYYNSEDYQAAIQLRLPHSNSTIILVEGAD